MDNKIMFGRENELLLLQKAYDDAIKNGGSCVFVSGDAGIGKTHLINVFAEHAKSKGAITAYVQCSSMSKGEELYKPCNDLVNKLQELYNTNLNEKKNNNIFSKFDLSKMLDVGSEILGIVPGVELIGTAIKVGLTLKNGKNTKVMDDRIKEYKNDRASFYSDMFLGMSMMHPLVIFIDDLHWADVGTISVIRNIFQELSEFSNSNKPVKLLLICSMREIESKVSSHDNCINNIISFMKRYDLRNSTPLYRAFQLDTLSEVVSQELFTYELDYSQTISKGLTSWILEKSGGNPLVLKICVDALKYYGVIFLIDNVWNDANEISRDSTGTWNTKGKLLAAEKSGAFAKKSSIALEVLRDLNSEQQSIIYHAAIQGDIFSADVLSHILNIRENQLLWDLNKLQKQGFFQRVDSQNDGLEDIYWFKFKAQVLREAILEEYLPKQLREVEEKIADFLANKIEKHKQAIETIEELEEVELGKQIDLINIQKSKIRISLVRMSWEASIHYEKSYNYIDAAKYALYNMGQDIYRLEEMRYSFPSPNEKGTLSEKIEEQSARIFSLLNLAFTNILNISKENKSNLISIKINVNTNLAKFYEVIGEYNKSQKCLSVAEKLAYLTTELSDEIEIYCKYISLSYASGNLHIARKNINTLINYINDNIDSIEHDVIENAMFSISYNLYLDTHAVAAKNYNLISNILKKINSENKDYFLSMKLLNEIKHENYIGSKKLFKQIVQDTTYDILVLIDAFEKIAGEVRLLTIEHGQYNNIDISSGDDEGNPLDNPTDKYQLNWRFFTCDILLEFFSEICKRQVELGIGTKVIAKLDCITIDTLLWLRQNSVAPEISELDEEEDEYEIYIETSEEMICIRQKMKAIYEKFIHQEHISKLISGGLEKVKYILSENEWAKYATDILSSWPETQNIETAKHLFEGALECALKVEDENLNELLVYGSWIDFLINKPNDKKHIAELIIIKNNILEKIIPDMEKNDLRTTAQMLEEIVIKKYYYNGLLNDDQESIIKRCFELHINNQNVKSAKELIEFSKNSGCIDNALYKNLKSRLKKCSEIFEQEESHDIVDVDYKNKTELEDFYIRLREAEKYIQIATSEDDEELIISLLYKASELLKNDDRGLTILDNLYSQISDFWTETQHLPDKKKLLIYSKEKVDVNLAKEEIGFYQAIVYSYKSLTINKGLKDIRRVYDEYKRINSIVTENFDEVSMHKKLKILEIIMVPIKDYVLDWINLVYEFGLIEDAISIITNRSEQFDGYKIDDAKELEQIRPDIDIKMAKAIVNYLKDNGYDLYIEDYKNRLVGLLVESKFSEEIINTFSCDVSS